jgi:hypothetical protein
MGTLRRYGLLFLTLVPLLAVMPAVRAQDLPPTVAPDSGPPGTRFLFGATGFAPGERLSFWLNRPDGQVEAAVGIDLDRASDAGDAVWSWASPGDARLGAWQMVVHGRTSNVERVIPFAIAEQPAAGAEQPFNVVPQSGEAGTLFRFYATGYTAREYVDVQVQGPNGVAVPAGDKSLVVAEPASAAGRIDGSWVSPPGAAQGEWRIVARGTASGVTRTIAVTLSAPNVGRAHLDVTPDTAAPGMRLSFSAAGFAPDEEISVWLNLPDGRVAPAEVEGSTRAAPDGRAGWTWVSPAEGPPGGWQMVAHGRASGVELVASFVLR